VRPVFPVVFFFLKPIVTVDEFISYWQTKREQDKRGIIEVIQEVSP
jgi:hypothetical protein